MRKKYQSYRILAARTVSATGPRGASAPQFSEWGGGKDMFVPPPLSDPEFRPRHGAYTDICDVTLAWLASRCSARQMGITSCEPAAR